MRRLVQQQGGLATATPYGGAMPTGSVPTQAAQQHAAPRGDYVGSNGPGMQRPATNAFAQPHRAPPPPPPPPEPEIDEIEPLSYDGDIEEVVEEDEEAVNADAYATEDYSEDADVSTETEGNVYTVDADEADQGDPYAASVASEAELAEQIHKALADANSFRRVRLYAKALETLRGGLDLDPRSMDLREAHRDVLIEAGYTAEAVQEMLVIAGLYVDALDGDSAARALQDVLAFDPTNARAIEMLQELGYEIVDENEENARPRPRSGTKTKSSTTTRASRRTSSTRAPPKSPPTPGCMITRVSKRAPPSASTFRASRSTTGKTPKARTPTQLRSTSRRSTTRTTCRRCTMATTTRWR